MAVTRGARPARPQQLACDRVLTLVDRSPLIDSSGALTTSSPDFWNDWTHPLAPVTSTNVRPSSWSRTRAFLHQSLSTTLGTASWKYHQLQSEDHVLERGRLVAMIGIRYASGSIETAQHPGVAEARIDDAGLLPVAPAAHLPAVNVHRYSRSRCSISDRLPNYTFSRLKNRESSIAEVRVARVGNPFDVSKTPVDQVRMPSLHNVGA